MTARPIQLGDNVYYVESDDGAGVFSTTAKAAKCGLEMALSAARGRSVILEVDGLVLPDVTDPKVVREVLDSTGWAYLLLEATREVLVKITGFGLDILP